MLSSIVRVRPRTNAYASNGVAVVHSHRTNDVLAECTFTNDPAEPEEALFIVARSAMVTLHEERRSDSKTTREYVMSNDMPPHEALTRMLGLAERYQVEELVLHLLEAPCSKGQFRPMHDELPPNLRFLREEVIILEHAREAVQPGSDGRMNEEVKRLLMETTLRSLRPLPERQVLERVSRFLRRAPVTIGARNLCAYYAERLHEAFRSIHLWGDNDALREKWLHATGVYYGAESFEWGESPMTGKLTLSTLLAGDTPATLYLCVDGKGEVLVSFTVGLSKLSEPFTHALQTWPRPLNWRQARGEGDEQREFTFCYAVKVDTTSHINFTTCYAIAKQSICQPLTEALLAIGIPVSYTIMGLEPCLLGTR